MKIKPEIEKIVNRVKSVQAQLQKSIETKSLVEDARKFAEKQGKDIKKLITADAAKVKAFVESNKKELEKLQKQIPGEVKKLGGQLAKQRKELEKILKSLSKKPAAKKKSTAKAKTAPKTTAKKASTGGTRKKAAPAATAAN